MARRKNLESTWSIWSGLLSVMTSDVSLVYVDKETRCSSYASRESDAEDDDGFAREGKWSFIAF